MNSELNNLLPIIPGKKAESDIVGSSSRNNSKSFQSRMIDDPGRNIKSPFSRTFEIASKKALLLQGRDKKYGSKPNADPIEYSQVRPEKKPESFSKTKIENINASMSVKRSEDQNKSDSQNATEMVHSTMQEIGKVLGLSSETIEKMNSFQFQGQSDFVSEQFSEILYSLKSIVAVLQQSINDGTPTELQGVIVDPQKALSMVQGLQQQILKLEMAFSSMGLGGQIFRSTAEKMGIPLTDGGIPQASNPENLSMNEKDLQKVTAGFIDGYEKKISAAVARIVDLAVKSDTKTDSVQVLSPTQESIGPLVKKELSNDVVSAEYSTIADTNKNAAVSIRNISSVDPGVLRKLLHLEGDGKTGEKNRQSDESNTLVSAESENPVKLLSTGLKDPLQKKFADTLQNKVVETTTLTSTLKPEHQRMEVPVKLSLTTMKGLEESVMLQVSNRLSEAVKQGYHEVRIVLKPEALGDVRITIQMNGDLVMAKILVENQQVKQIIESNLQHLKDALSEQNLQTGSFDVNVQQQNAHNDENETNTQGMMNPSTMPFIDQSIQNSNQESHTGMETGKRYGLNTVEYFA